MSFFRRNQRLPGLLFLLALLVAGVVICNDYGVSWDEPAQREIGRINLEVARTANPGLLAGLPDKEYGAAFELPLRWLEEALGLKEYHAVTQLRHVCTFLYFAVALWCGYLLALRLYKRTWIALAGLAMLALHPRIFAHAFFNTKDVPFLSATLIALYALHVAFDGRRTYAYALAGAACGYAAGIRTMGLLLPALAFLLMIMDLLRGFRRQGTRGALVRMAAFAAVAAITLYACWPGIWLHPVDGLLFSVQSLAHFVRWGGSLFFNGQEYAGTMLPWYYAVEWIGISTPLLWLLAGVGGMACGAVRLLRQPVPRTGLQQTLWLCAAMFLLPLVSVIVLHSVLYDDWRQLYFVYPPFVMMALYGLWRLERYPRAVVVAKAACLMQAVATLVFMVQAHPFQQVYFNPLVPHRPEYLRTHFDYDYWGVSTKSGLLWLLANDHRTIIPLADGWNPPLHYNVEALPPDQRQRFQWVEENTPGAYLLTNYRNHPEDYPYPKVWGIVVGGSTVLQIYRVDTSQSPRAHQP